MGVNLQLAACKRILIVADEEAFQTRRLLFLFLDAWVDASDIIPFGDSRLTEMGWFMEEVFNGEEGAKFGVKCKSTGIRGTELYQVEHLLRLTNWLQGIN